MAGHLENSHNRTKIYMEVECPEPVEGQWFLYILQLQDESLYIGQTKNLKERLRKHKYGLGSKFTKTHCLTSLVFFETHQSLDSAVKRERQLKRWSRAKKEALIQQNFELLKRLSRSQ